MTPAADAPIRKKLIEVSLPLEDINAESAREKSIRHGHPSTLHLWWARRPLAAARAVLFSQLVDDPSSDASLPSVVTNIPRRAPMAFSNSPTWRTAPAPNTSCCA